ncbi:MAG TPA: hypothetical protein VGM20_03720 [Gemmatimonadales bacterium]|jgi:hypothetical protein
MKSDDVTMLAIATLVVAAILLLPVFRAWARRIDAQAGDGGATRALDDLRQRVADLEASNDRILELEERVDFAERMLVGRTEDAPPSLHRTPV